MAFFLLCFRTGTLARDLPTLNLQPLFFPGRCLVTIFLTDLDGTVRQHDGNVLAVDGFHFFDGNVLVVDGKSNFDGIFSAVTQHDGKVLEVDGCSFFDGKVLAVDGK